MRIGIALHGTSDFHDFLLHVVSIFSHVPGNHNLEGHILLILDVTGQPDSGESVIAKFMLYAVCLNEYLPDADRIE